MQQFKSLAYTKTGLTDGWVINIIPLAILLCGVLLPCSNRNLAVWPCINANKECFCIAIKANMVQEYGKTTTHAETKLKENMLWTQWVNFHLLCEQLIFQKKKYLNVVRINLTG